jgi:hypothetical protein
VNLGIYMIIGTKVYFNSGDTLDTRTGHIFRWAGGDGGFYGLIKGLDTKPWYR